MIVLNENEWAYEMIQSKTLGKKPYETLCRVAKYYIDKYNYAKKDVRKILEDFLMQCDPGVSLPKWDKTIDYAINRAYKYDAVVIDKIDISKTEMEKIDALSGKQAKRLAFTVLCLAKYWNKVNPNGDCWVNSKDSDIMRMANINTSIKRQSLLYHYLNEEGLIQFSRKVDNTNVRVTFVDDGPAVFSVTDLRNLGYQYLMYHGEPFFVCENCGITTKIKNPSRGRKQKYCADCANKIKMQQIVNSVMRKRQVAARFE